MDKDITILDMGYGGSNVLRFLFKNNFQHIYGIDLTVPYWDRWQQLMYFKNKLKLPYYLSVQSVTKTNFKNEFFDVLICLSVIEHNVNLNDFFAECSRILKKDGILYISTDYWEDKIDTSDAPINYGSESGKEWTIFSKKEIQELIVLAKKIWIAIKKKGIPKCGKPISLEHKRLYFSIIGVFEKVTYTRHDR